MAIWYKILFKLSSLASKLYISLIGALPLFSCPEIRTPKPKAFPTGGRVTVGSGALPRRIWMFRNSGLVTTCPLYWLGLEICHEIWKGTIRGILLYSLLALFTLSQLQKRESLFHCLEHKLKHMFNVRGLLEAMRGEGIITCFGLPGSPARVLWVMTGSSAAFPKWSPWVTEKPKLC